MGELTNASMLLRPFLRPLSSSVRRCLHSPAIVNEASLVEADHLKENWRLRQHLALSYRLLDSLQLNEGSCNHISVMAPARADPDSEVMLIAPGFVPEGGGIDWSNVTASSLLGLEPAAAVVEGQGVPELSGAVIHLGVRRARPAARVVMHTHTPYATATELEEGERLGKVMGDKDVLFMCHHGTLIVAENIHIAFDDLYYLERACMTQLMAMGAAGREALKEMPLEVQKATSESIWGAGGSCWTSMLPNTSMQ